MSSLSSSSFFVDIFFSLSRYTLRHPIEFTVLTLHKSLVLIRHLAIYGSQKAANAIWILKSHIEPLKTYNTVLLALDNPTSMLGRIQRIKGGNVERGESVRKAANDILNLLHDVAMFQKLRAQSQDPDSLVPVGHKEEVAFVSDDIRKAISQEKLKKRKQQFQVNVKSNLKTPDEAIFGAGYTSKDGSTVVGAAHGIEDMLKIAELQTNAKGRKYVDDVNAITETEDEKRHKQHLQNLKQEFQQQQQHNNVADLLDLGSDQEHEQQHNENLTKFSSQQQPEANIITLPTLPYPSSKEDLCLSSPDENYDDLLNLDLTTSSANKENHDDNNYNHDPFLTAMDNMTLGSNQKAMESTQTPSDVSSLQSNNLLSISHNEYIIGGSSALEIPSPSRNNVSPTSYQEDIRPPIPPTLPMPLTMCPPVDPSSPPPLGNMPPPPPEPIQSSSPPPMGGIAPPPPEPLQSSTNSLSEMTPSANMNMSTMMGNSSMNEQQEKMMMMLMNHQQQMMQHLSEKSVDSNNNNTQQQMMEQMMLMNQQMMQQIMSLQDQSQPKSL